MTLPATYCSWADLIIRIPLGHSVYRIRLAKGTGGNGIGWTVDINLGGIYNYTIGNISQVRVVDLGSNATTHVDVMFNGNATRDIKLSMLQEVASYAGTYATLVACTDQGTGAAGIVYNLTYFNADTTSIGTTYIHACSGGGSFSHLNNGSAQSSRWLSPGGIDMMVRASSVAGVIGTRTAHPLNFLSSNATQMVLETTGDLTLNQSLGFGSRTGQHINLYSTAYGIGVQGSTLYQRTNSSYSWHLGGVHSDTANDPGSGGAELMRLTTAGLYLTATNAWCRTYGSTGLYNQTYGGGIYMIDSTFVRTYNAKSFQVARDWDGYYGNLHLNGNAPSITFWDTDNAVKWLLQNNADAFYIYRCATGTEAASDWVFKMSLNSAGVMTLPSTGSLIIGTTQIVGARVTGFAAATGTATKTTFATDSVTLIELARRVKAISDALISHRNHRSITLCRTIKNLQSLAHRINALKP
jgi:hypothetical protein